MRSSKIKKHCIAAKILFVFFMYFFSLFSFCVCCFFSSLFIQRRNHLNFGINFCCLSFWILRWISFAQCMIIDKTQKKIKTNMCVCVCMCLCLLKQKINSIHQQRTIWYCKKLMILLSFQFNYWLILLVYWFVFGFFFVVCSSILCSRYFLLFCYVLFCLKIHLFVSQMCS